MTRTLALLTSGLILILGSLGASAAEANLTRFLAAFHGGSDDSGETARTFFGTAGPAALVLKGEDVGRAKILINGVHVSTRASARRSDGDTLEVPVTLKADTNSIRVSVGDESGKSLSVRIRQHAAADYQVVDYLTYSGPTRNYELSEAFYADLGWTTGIKFPDTNTQAVASELASITRTTCMSNCACSLTARPCPSSI